MAWNLADIISPPSPQTNKYIETSPNSMYEVIGHATEKSSPTNVPWSGWERGEDPGDYDTWSGFGPDFLGGGSFGSNHESQVQGLGQYWNQIVNSDNAPPFQNSGEVFWDVYTSTFEPQLGPYNASMTGSAEGKTPEGISWKDQKGERATINQDFVTDTVQEFDNFAHKLGFNIQNIDAPPSMSKMFKPWEFAWDRFVPETNYKENIDLSVFDTAEEWTDPEYFKALAMSDDPNISTNAGAGLTYSRAIEDLDRNFDDAEEDALNTLNDEDERINKMQADQQRKLVEDLRAGRSTGGIRGTRTGRGVRRNMPPIQDITLQREKARKEYDLAIDRAVTDVDVDEERASNDLENAVKYAITGPDGLKQTLETIKAQFHLDDLEVEKDDAQGVLDILQGGGGNPDPWPGKCPSGKSWNPTGGGDGEWGVCE